MSPKSVSVPLESSHGEVDGEGVFVGITGGFFFLIKFKANLAGEGANGLEHGFGSLLSDFT